MQDTLAAYGGAFVDELVHSGITHVVISPGSRSTPLALLMSAHPSLNVWMHIDERSAGFFALGIAKAKNEAVALLCTSGTAAANYYPAVIEAHYDRVPLLVITADRPHELRDVGAPQAIHQVDLFGKYPKWFADMSLPEESSHMIIYARKMAARAAAATLTAPAGPVHLNFPFREPLIPNLALPSLWENGRQKRQQYTTVLEGKNSLSNYQFDQLMKEINGKCGLIVCGPDYNNQYIQAVTALSETLKFPILADPLSQLRSGSHDKRWVIESYDAFLKEETVSTTLKPEVIIRFGAMPVSKAFLLYIKKHPACRQIIVDEGKGWREPTLLASEMIYTNPETFCEGLIESIHKNENGQAQSTNWGQQWLSINEKAKEVLELKSETNLFFEGQVFPELTKLLPPNSTLFVGNSMPVRDLDTFFLTNELNVRTMANRGANGIDGIISSALGASTNGEPLVLVIGDLSFYHDLNGLLAAKLHELTITIIVLNNDGGGIFSFLPQSKESEHFEKLFGTPIGLDFEHTVTMYNGNFTRVSSWEDFRSVVKESLSGKGLNVIEVPTDRNDNAVKHHEIWEAVKKAAKSTLLGAENS
ncbi:2-succinyl-5-enolpyruvyl-6-hydroxy-3-cyclohexene-1-carboxylic-acid synthase [Bacillus taeanensis]|uniref:2-succinyl-5-enolpyruvyl-6-hydroxy-3-cyclohexene-1-carboxylate synthase n=1 Tax=Bacillus taeanensis TaxID=273032 RepID=A0A366Y2L9_9BACI|nr:2-succinyl-5-enolpyruvyl-6-hydroxy-3-cyclohexene-1-carboxylic-acid synthase [Bacillus taeanensis]